MSAVSDDERLRETAAFGVALGMGDCCALAIKSGSSETVMDPDIWRSYRSFGDNALDAMPIGAMKTESGWRVVGGIEPSSAPSSQEAPKA